MGSGKVQNRQKEKLHVIESTRLMDILIRALTRKRKCYQASQSATNFTSYHCTKARARAAIYTPHTNFTTVTSYRKLSTSGFFNNSLSLVAKAQFLIQRQTRNHHHFRSTTWPAAPIPSHPSPLLMLLVFI